MKAPLTLATGPVSWGVDFADAPANPPWAQVLDETVAAGYRVTELGPIGYLPEDPARLREELARRSLSVAGSFLFQPLHDPAALSEVLAVARRTCAAIAAVGGRYLIVIDAVCAPRAATAGRGWVAPRLDTAGQGQLVEAVRRVAALAAEDFGLRAVIHNHAGTYLEFDDEIEAMLEATKDDPVGLCIDTGHAAYGGINPVELVEKYSQRLQYLHLKDIDEDVHAEVVAKALDFWSAIGRGVFCPLDRGVVSFPRLRQALTSCGFDGWGTVEQDRDPHSGAPVDDLIASREYLERIGLAAESQPASEALLRRKVD